MTKLFWKLVLAFLGVLLLVAALCIVTTLRSANQMSMEVLQRLNYHLAEHTVHTIQPLLQSENPDLALQDIMHSMMVINPGVEVYLLNETGEIVDFVAPEKVVQLKRVSLEPVKQFLQNPDARLILGDDPRHPENPNIFSAAPIINQNDTTGFIYIILASDLYNEHENILRDSYVFASFYQSLSFIVLIALLLGSVGIYYITRNIDVIIVAIKKFKEGDLSVRMPTLKGELSHVASTFNDMADTIEHNISELTGVEQLRKELISNISHDLRTPIASIHGYSELLQMKGQQLSVEEKTEYLDVVLKNITRLRNLVDDLFELSKLESRSIELVLEPLSLQELIADLSVEYRTKAKDKNIQVTSVYSTELPFVSADIQLIDRVLHNLLDNALKFCREGDTIALALTLQPNQTIRVAVSDTGIGIPQEALAHIFDRYYKVSGKASTTGSGLGLAISKKILELHGATIHVQSEVDQGTLFYFDLPVYTAS
ncbi:MAG: hypothetical protein RL226_2178 [Bacteroidota bacterium]|jgi:signal transduction histidine kinase